MEQLKKNNLFLLVLACIAIFFVNLDALWVNIMEARNFATAREMLQDNNWLLTTLNGYPRYQKPPLPTWVTAFSAAIFGLKSLFAMRLPAALITLLLILTTYKLALKHTAHKTYSFVSALILATSFYIVFSGRNGQWDIFTHGFMMVCIYQLYLFFTSETRKYQRIIIAALFFGCSFMSKGPVSLYALLLPFLIAFGCTYKYRDFKSRILPLVLFLVVAFVLSGWWHYYTYLKDPETVLAITNKETGNWTSYNVRPFYYYWSFFTQSGIWTIPAFISLLYPYLKNRVFDKKAYLFTFLWTMASVVLLSIIPEKKSRYLLPVLIPLALNCGFYIEYLFRRFSEMTDKKETIPVYFNFGLIGLIGIAFPIVGFILLKDAELGGKWVWFILVSLALFIIGIAIFKNLKSKKIRPVFFLTIAVVASMTSFGLPLVKSIQVNPDYRPFSELKKWQETNDMTIYELTFFTPEVVWDYGDNIPTMHDGYNIQVPNEDTFGVLVTKLNQKDFDRVFLNTKKYDVKKITRYDINAAHPKSNGYKDGLWRDLYVIKPASLTCAIDSI